MQPYSPKSFERRPINGFFRLCVISDTSTPSSPQILRSMSTLSDIGFFLQPVRMISQMLIRSGCTVLLLLPLDTGKVTRLPRFYSHHIRVLELAIGLTGCFWITCIFFIYMSVSHALERWPITRFLGWRINHLKGFWDLQGTPSNWDHGINFPGPTLNALQARIPFSSYLKLLSKLTPSHLTCGVLDGLNVT